MVSCPCFTEMTGLPWPLLNKICAPFSRSTFCSVSPSRGKSHTCAKVANWYGLSLLHCSPLPLSPSSAQLKSSSAPDLKIIYVGRRGNLEAFCRRRPSGGHCQNGGCILLHFASRSFLFGSTPGRLVMEKFPSCKFCLAN